MKERLLIQMKAERMDSEQLAAELRRIEHGRTHAESPRQERRFAQRAEVMLEAWARLNGGTAHQCPRCGRPARGAVVNLCDPCAVAQCGGTRGT